MECPECGFGNIEGAKFCNQCGTSLAAVSGEDGASEELDERDPDSEESSDQNLLELPAIYTENVSSGIDFDEFDFTPLDEEELVSLGNARTTVPFASDPVADTSGLDEYLIDSGYSPPRKAWQSGDTMEMPRIEGEAPKKQTEFRAPETDRKSSRKRITAVAIVLFIVVAALAVFGITYQMELWGGKSLPDVVGLDVAEASGILEERGFSIKVLEVKSDDTENIVLLMDPGAGRRLSEGSEVVLQVATPRIIPQTEGLTLDEVRNALESEGFENYEVTKVKSNEPENTILSIEPASGTPAKSTTKVVLTIAEPYRVPDTSGLDMYAATELLEAEGFVTAIVYQYTEDTVEGYVVSTVPEAGAVAESGSTVTINVTKSRATELVSLSYSYMEQQTQFEYRGTLYQNRGVGGIWYLGAGKTQANVTVVGVTTLPDGEVVAGAEKQITITLVWNDGNEFAGFE